MTFAVAVDRSEGSTSLHDGELELMVHRRLLFDDGENVIGGAVVGEGEDISDC